MKTNKQTTYIQRLLNEKFKLLKQKGNYINIHFDSITLEEKITIRNSNNEQIDFISPKHYKFLARIMTHVGKPSYNDVRCVIKSEYLIYDEFPHKLIVNKLDNGYEIVNYSGEFKNEAKDEEVNKDIFIKGYKNVKIGEVFK